MKNGIKYILIAGMITAAMAFTVRADITVGANALINTYMADSSGAYLPAGSGDLIYLGRFSTTPTVGTFDLSGFTVFCTGAISPETDGSFGVSGGVVDDTGWTYQQIYVVVFNATTQAGATQAGVYSLDKSVDSRWRFPAGTDAPQNDTTVDIDMLFADSANNDNMVSGAHIWFGDRAFDPAGYVELELAPIVVPEPSTLALVGLGLLGAIGLIRRRR